jgi:hypothetical protein
MAILSIVYGIATLIAILVIWRVFWSSVSRLCWRGYNAQGQRPPTWRLMIANVADSLATFKPHRIPAKIYNAKRLGGTHRQSEVDR